METFSYLRGVRTGTKFIQEKFLYHETFPYLCTQGKPKTDMPTLQLTILEEARNFLESLPGQARKKMLHNIWRVTEGEKNSELFKKLEGSEIWEFRAMSGGMAYRLLSFWDKEERSLVVATHGFTKKAQKTPKKEIVRAEAIMRWYYEQKSKNQ